MRFGFSKDDAIPDKTTLLIMMNPGEMNDRQRFEVQRYLSEGGTDDWEVEEVVS